MGSLQGITGAGRDAAPGLFFQSMAYARICSGRCSGSASAPFDSPCIHRLSTLFAGVIHSLMQLKRSRLLADLSGSVEFGPAHQQRTEFRLAERARRIRRNVHRGRRCPIRAPPCRHGACRIMTFAALVTSASAVLWRICVPDCHRCGVAVRRRATCLRPWRSASDQRIRPSRALRPHPDATAGTRNLGLERHSSSRDHRLVSATNSALETPTDLS